MRRLIQCLFLAALLPLVPPASALAQEAASRPSAIMLSGSGIQPVTLVPASLSRLPTVTLAVSFMTGKGEEKGLFEGVPVWDLLKNAGLLKGAGNHGELRRVFAVTGRDGYEVLFSVGEIAPDFGATPAMIALKRDGKPLPAEQGLRLIVPGDKRGARNVRDVVKIELR